jgi:hypothetical protein
MKGLGGRSHFKLTIDKFPDVALLEIFKFYMDEDAEDDKNREAWHTLVHVCRKWRSVAFGSPRRLNIRLRYNARTLVREMLDVWPPLPIAICLRSYETSDVDNTIAALEDSDRICEVDIFYIPSSQIMEKVLAAMQRPFPALTCLGLGFVDQSSLVIPALFLGGSAPSLQTLCLDLTIPFPGLPNLLLSATHLLRLHLHSIPHSGYISPEAMVTCLSVLTRLESLSIEFESPRSRPNPTTRRSSPQTRILLPVLTRLTFFGVSEYLGGLVALIDAPLLDYLQITFLHQPIFDSPRLAEFISRTPKFKGHEEAHVEFSSYDQVGITLQDGALVLEITDCEDDWQLRSLAQVYSSSFARSLICTVERLYILSTSHEHPPLLLKDDLETSQWLEIFHLFTAVTDLYISSKVMEYITPALQELVGERVTEVLPSLQTIFFEEETLRFDREAIGQFVAARQLASRPLAVSRWEREDEESSDETDDESSYETDDE